jgi:hypothetical protein
MSVILNILAPLSIEELKEDLKQTNFITVSMDGSNRKDIEIVPVVVRYLLPLQGVKVKVLDLKSGPGETPEILSSNLVLEIKKHELEHKVIGLCAINSNTNVGGIKRRG